MVPERRFVPRVRHLGDEQTRDRSVEIAHKTRKGRSLSPLTLPPDKGRRSGAEPEQAAHGCAAPFEGYQEVVGVTRVLQRSGIILTSRMCGWAMVRQS